MQMASKRSYAYYLRGNQIAIIEEGLGSGVCSLSGYSNQTTCEAAGGTWTENATGTDDGLYRSPTATVADGLEIEYAYSPRYSRIAGDDQVGTNRHWKSLGYTSTNGGRLAFVLPNEDFSSGSVFTAGDKILVQNSSIWNGIHVVHSTAYLGFLVTTTNAGAGSSVTLSCDINATAKTITGNATMQTNQIADFFPSGTHYVMVGGTEAAASTTNDSELFKVTSDGEGVLTAKAQYSVTNGAVTESTSPSLVTVSGDNMALAKVTYDPFKLYNSASFDILEDESDTIDLPEYLAKALVYYVKAKIAEDQRDMEAKEYYLREFRAIVEKHESSKSWSARKVMPGVHSIR